MFSPAGKGFWLAEKSIFLAVYHHNRMRQAMSVENSRHWWGMVPPWWHWLEGRAAVLHGWEQVAILCIDNQICVDNYNLICTAAHSNKRSPWLPCDGIV